MMKTPENQRGFTLIEVMIVIALVGIVAGLSVGYSGSFFRKNRLNQLARGVYATVSTARAEAVRRSRRVIVTFSTGGVIAFVDQSTTPNWVYDDGTDIRIAGFNYAEANMSGSVNAVTTGLTTDIKDVGSGMSPMIIFDSMGRSVVKNGSNTIEAPAEVGVTFTHTGIPSGQNIWRRVSVTAGGAVRVTSQ